jgi:histidine ammonia-lyase
VARDLPGVTPVLAELRRLLQGGALLEGREPPAALQDPLSLRVVPQVHAVAATALDAATAVLEAELAAGSDNPLLTEDDRLLTNGNFDGTAVAVALDHLRLTLAHVGTLATERTQKLLTPSHSGLAANLRERDDRVEDGLGMYGHGAAALAAEIRLLASPVSLELPTSSLAEGIEDRVVPAPLAARRLDEQAGLLARLAAVELTCAAQAVELRGRAGALGEGTSALVRVVREHAPFTAAGTAPPVDLEPLVAALAGWTLDGT